MLSWKYRSYSDLAGSIMDLIGWHDLVSPVALWQWGMVYIVLYCIVDFVYWFASAKCCHGHVDATLILEHVFSRVPLESNLYETSSWWESLQSTGGKSNSKFLIHFLIFNSLSGSGSFNWWNWGCRQLYLVTWIMCCWLYYDSKLSSLSLRAEENATLGW